LSERDQVSVFSDGQLHGLTAINSKMKTSTTTPKGILMDRIRIHWGFALVTVAMLDAFSIPKAASPRPTLSTHIVGVMGGLSLISLAAINAFLSLNH